MILRMQWKALFLLVCMNLQVNNLHSADSFFSLNRIQEPVAIDLAMQKKLQFQRCMHRYAVTVGVAVSVCGILYGASAIRQSFDNRKQAQMVPMVPARLYAPAQVAQPIRDGSFSPVRFVVDAFKGIGGSMASFGWDISKFLADSATLLAAGVVTSAVYENMRQRIAQAYADESVLWFVEQQTKINGIFADLKQRTAEYDLHGSLLSSEMFNQDASVHLKAFVEDVSEAVRDYRQDDMMRDYGYFAYLLGELKSKYVRQADEYGLLQNQIAPHVARRQRALASADGVDLFERDQQSRQDIAELCKLFAEEMNKLLAFIQIHQHKQHVRIQDLVRAGNAYLEGVELMLNASSEQLAQMSKDNRGMFTFTYEYERLFTQQITFLHKYCKIVIA